MPSDSHTPRKAGVWLESGLGIRVSCLGWERWCLGKYLVVWPKYNPIDLEMTWKWITVCGSVWNILKRVFEYKEYCKKGVRVIWVCGISDTCENGLNSPKYSREQFASIGLTIGFKIDGKVLTSVLWVFWDYVSGENASYGSKRFKILQESLRSTGLTQSIQDGRESIGEYWWLFGNVFRVISEWFLIM